MSYSSESSGIGSLPVRGAGRGAMLARQIELATSFAPFQAINPLHDQQSTISASQTSDSGVAASCYTESSGAKPRGFGRGKLIGAFDALAPATVVTSQSSRSTQSSGESFGLTKLLDVLKKIEQKKAISSDSSGTSDTASTGEADDVCVEKNDSANEIAEAEQSAAHKKGSKGAPIQVVTNYIRLQTDPDKGVFQYVVYFDPIVHAANLKHRLLVQGRDIIGPKQSFDGSTLYLPILLANKTTTFTANSTIDGTPIQVTIVYVKKMKLRDCVHLYNVLFDRILKTLNYVRFGKKQFDPTAPKIIPQHKLEVWPGYVTAVDEYDAGVMLCLDVSHRVLCQRTVLDLLQNAYHSNKAEFQLNVNTALLGAVVLTRYNNRTYRIDEIDFDKSPMDTFETNDKRITFLEYYKLHYNIAIKDVKQPLLIHRKDQKIIGQSNAETITFCLIPELCYLTGLTDEMRGDFKVMRDIATHTQVSPNQRFAALNKFCSNVNELPEAKAILSGWGLTLQQQPLNIMARQLDEEKVSFAKREYGVGPSADFSRYATNNELIHAIDLRYWLLIHTTNDAKYARNFVDCMQRNSAPMGINVARPTVHVLATDKTELYVQALRKHVNADTQIVVIVCPTSRDDRYAAIKKVCCSELPIPSQVINARTLANETKNRAIVQKIALQMNCKMGGSLWSVRIPFESVMVCGIDTYHSADKKHNSVSAFVASLNGAYTRWYSRAVIQSPKEELINGLCIGLMAALEEYRRMNDKLPEKIIIYRDGVGNGQLNVCREYEIPQMSNACQQVEANYRPSITFIVVQKRINTRIFAVAGRDMLENPLPGCVLDHTVTRRSMYDFFLVPQSVRQGTVTPTHYIVVQDESDYSPDILQRLSYKLCFMYYNWPGTIRVPACCQYAHKLAYLVGESVKRPTAESLGNKLFYL